METIKLTLELKVENAEHTIRELDRGGDWVKVQTFGLDPDPLWEHSDGFNYTVERVS